jgi:hypothetical protein
MLKFLKAKELVNAGRDYYAALNISNQDFIRAYITLHLQSENELVEDFATACTGEAPLNFA